MRVSIWKVIPAGMLLLAVPGFASVHPKASSSRHHMHASMSSVSARHRKGLHLHAFHEAKAPVAMPAERATQIQAALIKQGYLTGEPTGTWDAQTVSAMQKLQGDNGWQTRITPDSRALIKLGLGPTQASAAPLPAPGAAVEGATNSSPDMTQSHPQ
jgi:hypothetical protein